MEVGGAKINSMEGGDGMWISVTEVAKAEIDSIEASDGVSSVQCQHSSTSSVHRYTDLEQRQCVLHLCSTTPCPWLLKGWSTWLMGVVMSVDGCEGKC